MIVHTFLGTKYINALSETVLVQAQIMLRKLLLAFLALVTLTSASPNTQYRLVVCSEELSGACDSACNCNDGCETFLLNSGECLPHPGDVYIKASCEDTDFSYSVYSDANCTELASGPVQGTLPACGSEVTHNFVECVHLMSTGGTIGAIIGIIVGFLVLIILSCLIMEAISRNKSR
jgi:hypothetical protein